MNSEQQTEQKSNLGSAPSEALSAQHTPRTGEQWGTSPNPGQPWVYVPGIVKPINAGSAERAARIVQCVNAHDTLLSSHKRLQEALSDARDLLAKDFPESAAARIESAIASIPKDIA